MDICNAFSPHYDNLNWAKIYWKCNKTSADVKLKWFQLRLLYRILPTNRLLYIKNIKENSVCNFCNHDEQTIYHLFWECPNVQQFWNDVNQNFIVKLPHAQSFRFSDELILFGTKDNVYTDKPIDLLILTAKYYIYANKMADTILNTDIFLKRFKQRYILEQAHSLSHDTNSQFRINWAPYITVLDEI